MMRLIKKFKILCIALLFMAGTVGLYYWIDQMIVMRGEALVKQSETIANQRAFESQYQQLQSIVATTELQRTQLDSYILQDDADTIELLTKIDSVASAIGVALETKGLNVEEVEKSNFNVLKLQYEIGGTEMSVMRMLQVFESLPYHGFITNVEVDRKRGGRNSGAEILMLVSLDLTIKDYD